MRIYDSERFWKKVDLSGGLDSCWRWTGAKTNDGYAQFYTGGRTAAGNAKIRVAHRYLFEQVAGRVPANRELDHLCHTRDCVNLRHLAISTREQNAGRHRRIKPRGPKLNSLQVRAIRGDGRTHAAIAAEFDTTAETVGNIKRRQSWRKLI